MSGGLVIPGDYDDWRWGGRGRVGGGTVPSFDDLNSTGIYCYQFTNGEELHFPEQQIPHDYKEGTDIQPHIHWCPTTTDTYTGTWTLDIVGWLSVATGEPIVAKQTFTAAFNSAMTALQNQSQDFNGVLSGLNRKISSIIHLRLSLSQSSGAECALSGLDGHYLKDRLGSKLITTK